MGKVLLLAVLLAGCVTQVDDGSNATAEWRPDVDDGFGYGCVADLTHVVTACAGADGHDGTCWAGVCRRTCESNGWANPDSPTLCPDGQHAELGPGGESDPHSCVCIPDHKLWQNEDTVPEMIESGTGHAL